MIDASFGEEVIQLAGSGILLDLPVPLRPVMFQKPIPQLSKLAWGEFLISSSMA